MFVMFMEIDTFIYLIQIYFITLLQNIIMNSIYFNKFVSRTDFILTCKVQSGSKNSEHKKIHLEISIKFK